MLLNRATADGIANGHVTLALRWDVARAKPGGTQRTSTGTAMPRADRRQRSGTRAPDLAAGESLDVPRFKRWVRRLKEMGLTISLDVGYRLSPRGRAFLRATR
ncbi:MAG: hypothetical protein WCB92_29525 [Mycobacterium sp.]